MICRENGEIISRKTRIVESFLGRMRGLMFRKPLKDEALILSFKRPVSVNIHMVFVFFPIDFLFLDEKGVIVNYGNLSPMRGFASSKNVKYVIELPSGTIKKHGLRVGERIMFCEKFG